MSLPEDEVAVQYVLREALAILHTTARLVQDPEQPDGLPGAFGAALELRKDEAARPEARIGYAVGRWALTAVPDQDPEAQVTAALELVRDTEQMRLQRPLAKVLRDKLIGYMRKDVSLDDLLFWLQIPPVS